VVAVHDDAQQPPLSRDARPHRFQVHPGCGDYRLYQVGQLPVVHRAGGTKVTGHFDLLVCVA
jgi:hypothetical protein